MRSPTVFSGRLLSSLALLATLATPLAAQSTPDSAMAGMKMGDEMEGMDHSPRSSLLVDHDKMGSGTTWIPASVPLPSLMKTAGDWHLMLHGVAFGQYDTQTGPRGAHQIGSLNWAMLMASRPLAGGTFQGRTMLSLDAAGVSSRGYPLLLQTGESFKGEPIHDRQHPHDLFMEIAALYQRPLSSRLAGSLYVAPSGEPALGPVAFMHRPSALDNPTAPISHHWQDATHISFGVVTAGLLARRFQVEASAFNGHDPDEYRWNIDPISLNSYSARATFNPSAQWSLSAGAGIIDSHESASSASSHTGRMRRFTASALWGIHSPRQSSFAFIWGANHHPGEGLANSVLAENETRLSKKATVFSRLEWVQKTGEELALGASASSEKYNVSAFQLGAINEVTSISWATLGIGASVTLNVVPGALSQQYGSRTPMGSLLFVRVRPHGAMVHEH